MRRSTLLYAVLGVLVAAPAAAGPAGNAANYNLALPAQLATLSSAITGPLVDGLAFATASQDFAPAGAKPTLGFNLGAGFGMSMNNIDKAAALAAGAGANTGGAPKVDLGLLAGSLPTTVPVALGQLNAHVGLPFGFDLGARYDNLASSFGDNNMNLTGYGVELRHNLLSEGIVVPVTLAIGAGYSRLYGNVHAQSSTYSVNGGTYGGAALTGNTYTTLDVDSDISAYSLRATLSRSFLGVVAPYVGVSADAYSGGTTVTVAQLGNVAVNGVGVNGRLAGSASQIAPGYEVRGAAGLKFNIVWLYLELGGEYGFVSGIGGGHAQVGVDFR